MRPAPLTFPLPGSNLLIRKLGQGVNRPIEQTGKVRPSKGKQFVSGHPRAGTQATSLNPQTQSCGSSSHWLASTAQVP